MCQLLHRDLLRPFKKISFACLTALALLTQANSASAELVGYAFMGTVTSLSPTPNTKPFSLTIPVGSSLSGQFFFDTGATAQNLSGDSGYQQSIVNGLTMELAGIPVRTNDYWVVVGNRDDQSVDPQDLVSIVFSTSLPPVSSSTTFFVNNLNKTAGRFSLTFKGGHSAFSSGALPDSTTLLGLLNSRTGFLTSSSSFTGANFQIESLVSIPVPEPAAFWLLAVGSVFFLRRFRCRGKLRP